mgnify:CR=1 FL=1
MKEVYTYTFDQTAPTKITNVRSLVVGPSWRPDLRAILFTSYKEHQPKLFQVDLASRGVSRLIAGPGTWIGGAWSPDGSKLYAANGLTNDVTIIDVATLKAEKSVPVGRLPWGIAIKP